MGDKPNGQALVWEAGEGAQGVFVAGAFLGCKWSAPYEIDGRTGTSKPKLGLQTADGDEIAVQFPDDATLRAAVALYDRGTVLTVAVDVRPPFERGRAVRYFLRGTGSGAAGAWE